MGEGHHTTQRLPYLAGEEHSREESTFWNISNKRASRTLAGLREVKGRPREHGRLGEERMCVVTTERRFIGCIPLSPSVLLVAAILSAGAEAGSGKGPLGRAGPATAVEECGVYRQPSPNRELSEGIRKARRPNGRVPRLRVETCADPARPGRPSRPLPSEMGEDCPRASQEYPPEFGCAVCLDLAYKPVVLPCGHLFCFWCCHRSARPLLLCAHSFAPLPPDWWLLSLHEPSAKTPRPQRKSQAFTKR